MSLVMVASRDVNPELVIVDYGMGNIGSLRNMFSRIEVAPDVTSDPERVSTAPRIVLPGVGAFDNAVDRLRSAGLWDSLEAARRRGTHILGVCLGMQLLLDGSDEGERPGLGWVSGRARRFEPERAEPPLRVPHMGWNHVKPTGTRPTTSCAIRRQMLGYYFVHSYFADCDRRSVVGTTTYGVEFASVIQRDNVIGMQFHPEKSHRFGMAILETFLQS